MRDISLSFFPLGPPVYVYATLHWAQEGRVHCRVTGCWVCSPGPFSPSSSSSEALDWNWTAGLVTTGCLTVGLRLWQPWHTFRTSLKGTDIAWHSHFITLSVNNQYRYFTGPQQTWLLAWSIDYITTHTNCEMLTGKNNKLCMQQCGYKLSPKSEKWNTVSRALNGVLQMKRMADKGLLIAAWNHIIAVNLVLSSYTLRNK